MAEKKEKQYVSDNAQLMAEWNWERNIDIEPSQVTLGSGKKIWWIGACGHEWEEKPNNRTSKNKYSCPYCSNHRILVGYNDLATTNPALATEWHPEKNGELTPETVTHGSNKKVWWICNSGHEFTASIGNRISGKNCPFCAGKKVLKGVNDLESRFPQIAQEWHPTKNADLSPSEISYGSTKKVWWICTKGHEYLSSPNNRTSSKKDCPYCNGHSVLKGFNDLETLFPNISQEWCYEKNNPVEPNMIFPHSSHKYWWICPACKSSYLSAVNNRTRGIGCPNCATRYHSSFAEQAIFFYVTKSYPDAINRYTEIFSNRMELDIFIPSQKIGIEYDGSIWHDSDESFLREKEKYSICKKQGIRIIRVREKPSSKDILTCDYLVRSRPYKNNIQIINYVINEIAKVLPLYTDYDVIRDEIEIKTCYLSNLGNQSLAVIAPELANEWDYRKNGTLLPSMVSIRASDKVWWKCANGHSWKAAIYNRSKGSGCPYCAGKKALSGTNDLNTTHPKLLAEWDYDKNSPLTPEMFLQGSNKAVWWICNKGHSWKTPIYNRAVKNTGCPYCSNNLVWEGFNDLQTLHPQLASEWNTQRNGAITPNRVIAGSAKKVWWLCPQGHEWEAEIRSRVRGNRCPHCAKTKRTHAQTQRKFPDTEK